VHVYEIVCELSININYNVDILKCVNYWRFNLVH
jgi:hypothetical protein